LLLVRTPPMKNIPDRKGEQCEGDAAKTHTDRTAKHQHSIPHHA